MAKREVVVFYAWQSDSPDETNRTAIRVALKKAVETLEGRHKGLGIIIDDATRGMVGAGNVPDSIRLKIEACDIFVGDVTTINPPSGPEDESRRCPNPNVAFEAGYAAAHIGWQRMIIVANTEFGPLDDLPFDFDRQRIAEYRLASAPNSKKRKTLATLMTEALEIIITGDPKRPAELRALDPKKVRRKRDVANIIWAMSQVQIARLEAIIEDLPDRVGPYSHSVYENFHAVVTSAGFHLYDARLAKAFRKLDAAWSKAFSYGKHYFHRAAGHYAFGNPRGVFPRPNEERDYQRIAKLAAAIRRQLNKLLDLIRSNYLEVDLDETDKAAIRRFRADIEEVKAALGPDEADKAPTAAGAETPGDSD